MRLLNYIFVFFFLFAPLFGQAQTIGNCLEAYTESHHLEKIYLSFDKPYYIPGDMLWAKVWHVDGRSHLPFDAHPIVYFDWIDPDNEVVLSEIVQLSNGTAEVSFQTRSNDDAGDYTIRAYTLYQRNFDPGYIYQKTIPLIDGLKKPQINPSVNQTVNVAFYPEGGNLVAGISSVVAFEVMDANGYPKAIEGRLMANNRILSKYSSNEKGFGKLTINPLEGESYYLEIKDDGGISRYNLPKTQSTGYVLKVDGTRRDKILITGIAAVDRSLLDCKLVAHVRGELLMEYDYDDINKKEILVKRSDIPSGIIHFTLFDKDDRPIAERLAFNINPILRTEVNIELGGQEFSNLSNVDLVITTTRETDFIPADFSVTVYNEEVIENRSIGPNIMDYFLLYSDLPDKSFLLSSMINDFQAADRVNLDLLMLTKGWRRFDWSDVLKRKIPTLNYPVEDNYTIAGKVSRKTSNRPVTADVAMTIMDDKQFSNVNLTTTNDGLFYFSELNLKDSVDILIEASIPNARKSKKKAVDISSIDGNREVDIEMIRIEDWKVDSSVTYSDQYELIVAADAPNYKVQSYRNAVQSDSSLWSINIDEVTVSAGVNKATQQERKIQEQYDNIGLFYFASTQKFLVDSLAFVDNKVPSIYELIQYYVPNSRVVNFNGVKGIHYGSISIINPLEGTSSSKLSATAIALNGTVLSDRLTGKINPHDVLSIDFVSGHRALSVYGVGAVFSIVTKDPSTIIRRTPGLLNYSHPGYHKPTAFYKRLIPDPNNEGQTLDYSTSLYWNAKGLTIDSPFETMFTTSSLDGKHCIQIEGMTTDGQPIYGKKCFDVR